MYWWYLLDDRLPFVVFMGLNPGGMGLNPGGTLVRGTLVRGLAKLAKLSKRLFFVGVYLYVNCCVCML